MKTIFTGFAPNLAKPDLRLASRFLFRPRYWRQWRQGGAARSVERWLEHYFPVKHAALFDSGRSALFFALRSLGVGEGDEVLVQAYTCVVVVNAIRWTGATPVYVDVCVDFTMNPDDFETKITAQTKALIIQHTFGIPAQMEKLLSIARRHNLKVIEDAAQALGSKVQGQKVGTFGDLGILSFGSDKTVSCVRGGGVVTNNDTFARRLRAYQNQLPPASRLKIFQHLMHYPVFAFGKRWYHWGVGKWVLWLAKKLHAINHLIYHQEKRGQPVSFYPAQLPNALAVILLGQLAELDKVIKHREWVAAQYRQGLKPVSQVRLPSKQDGAVFLRFPLLVDQPRLLRQQAKQKGILLGDWYQTVIAPGDIEIKKTGYHPGQCPRAEVLAGRSINLPTDRSIGVPEIERILAVVNGYGDQINNK